MGFFSRQTFDTTLDLTLDLQVDFMILLVDYVLLLHHNDKSTFSPGQRLLQVRYM